MTKRIKILYVDSNYRSAGQVLKYFNPPQYLTKELQALEPKKEEELYQFIFIHCLSFQVALKNLAVYNLDPLSKDRKLRPFDTVFFETKKRVVADKYSWLDFVTDIARLGILPDRLNLPYGLLAFGNQGGEAIKDQLMNYGVRKFIKRPFDLDELKQTLIDYFDTIYGSSRLYFEERKENEEGIIRRYLRYDNHAGVYTGIPLPFLQEEKQGNKTTLWLRNDSDIITEVVENEMVGITIENNEEQPESNNNLSI